VRIPACYTGLYGLKTSFGRVPIRPRGMVRWLDTSVYGPMTRTVRDAALYLDQIAGFHPGDPDSLPAPGYSYLEKLDKPLGRLRIAFNRTLGVTRVQPDVLREVEAAVDVFRSMGHEVVENDDVIPETGGWWARMGAFQGLASLWEEYTAHHDEFTDRYVRQLDAAHDVGPTDFREFYMLRAELNEWTERLFGEVDLLLTPTLPTEAFPAEGPIPSEIAGEPANAIAFTYPFNFTGHPAASVRAGLTDAGLPCGLQIVGQRHRDDLVLQASYAYERERPWQTWPAL
jgi:aspartyl-tRNA(Asn)/glutamyl-tRNA(Gln) amidotransferase subunit A